MQYATLHQVREYIRLQSGETADDELLDFFINKSVDAIDEYCRRRFDVRRETRSFDYPWMRIERLGVWNPALFVSQMNMLASLVARRLRLDDDLLVMETLTNGDGTEISSSSYVLEPANRYPKHAVTLKTGSSINWQIASDGSREQIIDVDGWWGFHTAYTAKAWVSTLDTVQDDPLAADATSLTVSDWDGLAADRESPRFQTGQLLQITTGGVVELLSVIDIDTGTDTLTVERGCNGTTGIAHAKNTAIYVYRPLGKIVMACTRLAVWRYRQKDVDTFDKAAILGSGVAIVPSAIPADVRELLPWPREPGKGLSG